MQDAIHHEDACLETCIPCTYPSKHHTTGSGRGFALISGLQKPIPR